MSSSPTNRARILVVDDVAAIRSLAQRILASQGYEVEVAASGHQALQLLASKAFDLVLLDVVMPDIDGLKICRRIREKPGLASLPVVLLSALDDSDLIAEAGSEAGATDFLSKPFSPTELTEKVQAAIASSASALVGQNGVIE